jgi:PKD repeat protein
LTQTNPYRVEFNPASSQDRDGDIAKAKFVWDFGDDSKPETVVGRSIITHEYLSSGQFRVRLRIEDEESKTDSTEQFIKTENQPPVAALQVFPQNGSVPLEISYNAAGSFDPDGSISSYQLLFGDGGAAQTATGKHIYATDKNYQIILIVKDNFGLADTANVPVSVSTRPVAVLKIYPPTGGPIPLRLAVSGKDSRDPHPGGNITAYLITITNVTTNAQQQEFPQDSVSTLLTVPGNYRISLMVTNNRGLSSQEQQVIPAGLP